MPVLILLGLALAVGLAAGLVTWRYPRISNSTPAPALATARKVGETVRAHRSLRALLKARLDPSVATGLALTLALILVIGGGVLFGVLTYLVRTNAHLAGLDSSVARWGDRHSSATSMHLLGDVTQLGSVYVVVALCLILATAETIRQRTAWVASFVLAVMVGEEGLTVAVKDLVDRLRPTFNPAAATLGPSFPSGHSATAAAFYATAALLLGQGRPRTARAALTGLALGISIAVAASRVLLDVHWLTDVIAGLTLGWTWFAVCGIAFGGRVLRLGAAAETAAAVAVATPASRASTSASSPPARRTPRASRKPSPLPRNSKPEAGLAQRRPR